MKPRHPSAAESARALAETAELTRIREARPKRDDILKALGKDSLVTEADGSWRIKVMEPTLDRATNLKRFRTVNDMMSGAFRMQTDRSQRRAAETQTVRMRGPAGDMRDMPVEVAAHAERKGFRHTPRYKGRCAMFTNRGVLYRALPDGSVVPA